MRREDKGICKDKHLSLKSSCFIDMEEVYFKYISIRKALLFSRRQICCLG